MEVRVFFWAIGFLKVLGLSQHMLAEALHIQQPAIARLEKRADMYISTLRNPSKP
ncbi:MAG: helix-turn-helix domain-containing protein [Treponema sp.]|jgi:predicted transcriptional regulator|nr:helix-turn-helix domain-containing protein [Treponema sp.]